MAQKNKREAQREMRRQQILECALDMINTVGFPAMTIRGIAEKLNISTGLFFNYFETKEQVYEELVRIGLSGPEGVLSMNEEGIQPIELFEQMAAQVFDSLKRDAFTGKMFLLMSHAMRSQGVPEGVKKLFAELDTITPLIGVVRKGQELGQIKKGDPAALLIAFWSAIQGIAEACAMNPGAPLPESGWVVDIIREYPKA